MIIVKNLKSKYINEINAMDKYSEFIHADYGILWIIKNLKDAEICGIDINQNK